MFSDSDLSLAQAQSAHNPNCHTTAQRAKEEIEDFYAIFNDQGRTTKWTDPQFSSDPLALYWSSMGEANSEFARDLMDTPVDWKRLASVVPNATLFGNKAITPKDVVDSSIGNCWFMSAVAGLAEHGGRVEQLFLNPSNLQSRNGIYGVNMYTMGIPHTILVDDYVPTTHAGNDQYYTIY